MCRRLLNFLIDHLSLLLAALCPVSIEVAPHHMFQLGDLLQRARIFTYCGEILRTSPEQWFKRGAFMGGGVRHVLPGDVWGRHLISFNIDGNYLKYKRLKTRQ